jgi:DNA-binding Xre family transcriptional regulator
MISYKPLWHTLIEKGVKKMDLIKLTGMSSGTLAKLSSDKYVALDVVERICLALDCKVQDVVEIKKGYFGAPIPKMGEVVQTGDDQYTDAEGNIFTKAELRINEALGGGFERAKPE